MTNNQPGRTASLTWYEEQPTRQNSKFDLIWGTANQAGQQPWQAWPHMRNNQPGRTWTACLTFYWRTANQPAWSDMKNNQSELRSQTGWPAYRTWYTTRTMTPCTEVRPCLSVHAGSPACSGVVAVYHFDRNQPSLPAPFYSVLVSISVFLVLSIVFHSINSLDSSPLSRSVLLVLFQPYRSFPIYISKWKSPSAFI